MERYPNTIRILCSILLFVVSGRTYHASVQNQPYTMVVAHPQIKTNNFDSTKAKIESELNTSNNSQSNSNSNSYYWITSSQECFKLYNTQLDKKCPRPTFNRIIIYVGSIDDLDTDNLKEEAKKATFTKKATQIYTTLLPVLSLAKQSNHDDFVQAIKNIHVVYSFENMYSTVEEKCRKRFRCLEGLKVIFYGWENSKKKTQLGLFIKSFSNKEFLFSASTCPDKTLNTSFSIDRHFFSHTLRKSHVVVKAKNEEEDLPGWIRKAYGTIILNKDECNKSFYVVYIRVIDIKNEKNKTTFT